MTAHRVERVRAAAQSQGVDAVLVTDLSSIRWLTGFTGSNAVVVVGSDEVTLATDGRYAQQAPEQATAAGADIEVRVGPNLVAALAPGLDGQTVAAEADHLTWRDLEAYREVAGDIVALDGSLAQLRAVKDADEIAIMRRAAAIADEALAEVRPQLADAPTERDVSLALEVAMRRRGATSSAYETIVASGPNAALPHARPTDRVIGAGDLVIIDVGALVDGYRSDMTRSFVIGEPDAQQAEMLELVRDAQAAGVAAVADGVAAREVDAACRDHIAAHGWGDAFMHGTGHGVGLDIHEYPLLNSRAEATLAANMPVTVEPGVYVAGVGGVRWEDLVVVGPSGCEVLTHSPKDPIV